MDITLLTEDIINEIGENAGFRMWNKRNKNKGYYQLNSEYSYDYYSNGPPNKNWIFSKTDFIRNEKYNVSSYVDWEIITNLKPQESLLQFKIVGDYYNYIGIYTINLHLCTFKTPILEDKKNMQKCKINSRNFTYDGLTFSSSFCSLWDEEVKDEI